MYPDFCKKLKAIRTEREMSQAKLAKILDRPQQDISKWELGIQEPNLADVVKLSLIFNVSSDYLLGISDEA